MKFCDVTIAYNGKSGGIRTFIDEKRRFLETHTNHEHVLIVPGERDGVERIGRSKVVYIEGPLLPKQNDYRFFLSPAKIRDALMAEQPDIVELGSYYMEPWAAFSYRKRRREKNLPCTIGGFFHTDVAEAYVAAPLRAAAHTWVEDISEALSSVMVKIADIAASGAEQYMRYVFKHCDVAMASTPAQAERLGDYDVERVGVVPMGVDLDVFNPRHRSEAVRARLGATPQSLVLAYAGRLCNEKRVSVLIEAFESLPADMDGRLWIIGDGPLREEVEDAAAQNASIRILPYENDRARFAALLASADLYVTAGPHETFGLSVIEAQASGLPVVGVDAGALRERVLDGLGYLGPVDDVGVMKDNVLRAAQDRQRLGRRARRHVEANFSWNATFRRLLTCYFEAHAQTRADADADLALPA